MFVDTLKRAYAKIMTYIDPSYAHYLMSKATCSDFYVPAPAGLEYLPYQKAGIEYASKRRHTLFGDTMGLGKTIQAIGTVNLLNLNHILVICPAILKINWAREFYKWKVNRVPITIVDSSFIAPPSRGVSIVNYDILGRLPWLFSNWDAVIMDEAHYIKNLDTQRAQLSVKIADYGDRVLALTGTPIPNRVIEMFPLLKALQSEMAKDQHKFATRYGNMKGYGRYLKYDGGRNLWELQYRLRSTVMVRRQKEVVLPQLPPKRRQVLLIKPDETVSTLVAEEKGYAEQFMMTGENKFIPVVNSALGKHKKLPFGKLSVTRFKLGMAKIPYAIEAIKNLLEQNEKVVVFTHHQKVAEAIAMAFQHCAVLVHGGLKRANNTTQIAIDAFQTDKAVRLFVGTVGRAGVGITLTAASVALMVETEWVPGVLEQAEDRLHRIGQKNAVLIQYLLFEGSVDVDFINALDRKNDITVRGLG